MRRRGHARPSSTVPCPALHCAPRQRRQSQRIRWHHCHRHFPCYSAAGAHRRRLRGPTPWGNGACCARVTASATGLAQQRRSAPAISNYRLQQLCDAWRACVRWPVPTPRHAARRRAARIGTHAVALSQAPCDAHKRPCHATGAHRHGGASPRPQRAHALRGTCQRDSAHTRRWRHNTDQTPLHIAPRHTAPLHARRTPRARAHATAPTPCQLTRGPGARGRRRARRRRRRR